MSDGSEIRILCENAVSTVDELSKILTAWKDLEDGSPVDLFSMTCATNSIAAVRLDYSVTVTDGSDFQVEAGAIFVSAKNDAGSVSTNISSKLASAPDAAVGLTVTFAASSANPSVLSCTADTSIAVPSSGYPHIRYTVANLSTQAIAVV